ncbi:MAG TPA: peptidase S41, partial [Porphyromonadaceae bacterium]|nr:peptidase S41 [Porphyromonadaceae bacterium]
KTSEAFAKDFEVNQAMLDDLLALAAAEKIEFNQEQYDKALPLIKLQIKALIARDLYDMGAYYEIINEVNDAYLKALQLIKDDKEYNAILNGKKTK